MATDFSPWNMPVVISGGVLYIAGRDVGNCEQVRLGAKFEVARHADYSSKVRRWGRVAISHMGWGGAFVTDSITGVNITLYYAGLELTTVEFKSSEVYGPPYHYTLTKATIIPAGESELINFDKTQQMGFTFEGTVDMPTAVLITE